jgi:hypothetical protein
MFKDSIVEELRALRARIAAEHGNELKAIIRFLKRRFAKRHSGVAGVKPLWARAT